MSRQLPLRFPLAAAANFEDFHAGPNQQTLDLLRAAARGTGPEVLWVWGPQGSGRSHLLQSACRDCDSVGGWAIYLPLRELADGPNTEVLEGLERADLVCLDDIDAVAANGAWEEALFHLHNRMLASGHRLVYCADAPPTGAGIALPDLRTRCCAALVCALRPLSDEDRVVALGMRARRHNFELSEENAKLLLRRLPRDLGALFEAVATLDEVSLAQKRRITPRLVREVIEAIHTRQTKKDPSVTGRSG